MKRKLSSIKSNLFTRLLAFIFPSIILAGCPIGMYGTPSASYTTSGHVRSEEGRPLQGIKVSVGGHPYKDSLGQHQIRFEGSALTNVQGEYQVDIRSFPLVEMIVIAEDVDGEEGGGEYQSDTLVLKDFKYKDEGVWYSGHAKVSDVNFNLKKK
ncbi:MAG: radical SAM-associated putative lipoprotein [Bacteroidales bacterium]|jgi:putative lipoprotein (rSAM/lipoprotein system)|nr:radical SAM-associated putative lipoprotein [Bacteroidales bacterium]